jgi:glycosyltransferase involved in cell wall biosynthesis
MNMVCITIAWNEEELLPVFLNHYDKICSKIIVYDNESDDRTAEICDLHPLVERRVYKTDGQIRDDVYIEIKNNAWKEFRDYDWVCVLDLDEFVYHENLELLLETCKRKNISIPQTTGYSMWSESMPNTNSPIWKQINKGIRDTWYDKTPIFDPKLIEDINYKHGCHACYPSGSIVYDKYSSLKLLHCKNIGGIKRLEERRKLYEKRLSHKNIEEKWGHNYQFPCRIKEDWDKHLHFSEEVIDI